MANEDEDHPISPEKKAIQEARAEAKVIIDEEMRQGMLRTFHRLLLEIDSGEQHRFSSMIEWAVKLLGEDPILDQIAISRLTMRRWVEGTTTPGPLARSSVINRLETLVINRFT